MAGKMKISTFTTMAVVLATGTLLAACSKSSEEGGRASVLPAKEGSSAAPEKRGKIKMSLYDRGNTPPAEGTVTNNRWTKWINENGPADVEFVAVPRFEAKQKFNTLFASGEAPDVINEFETGYRDQLYSQKQLLPLEALIKQYAPNYSKLLEKYPIMRQIGTKPDGKLYEIGRVIPSSVQIAVFIRTDWLTKLSLQVPHTLDDLLKVAKAFTEQDPDGNGKKDTYGYSLAYLGDEAIDAMNGNTLFIKDDKLIEEDARMKAAVTFKKRLFDEGVVDRDYLTDKNGEKAKKDFLSGKLGIYVADNPNVDLLTTLRSTNRNATIAPMLMPKTEFGQYTIRMLNPLQMTTVVYAGSKDPVAAVKTIDFMIAEPTWKSLKFGTENVHWKNDELGCPRPINPDLRKIEIGYNTDLYMGATTIDSKEVCNVPVLDKNIPNAEEWAGIRQETRVLYENPAIPLYTFTHGEHMPTLPADLLKINNDWIQQSKDLIAKTVVSGGAYTVDQAMNDLKSLKQKIGQDQTIDWYAKWFEQNKKNAFLTKDIYQFLAKK
ncbi:extracellular solute-binding protein [Paenibacillus sp. LMG 31456]|uniref:Extracellular solute-binding protein n=1 Tax=Paenibacillus foliorum TaxID=2654974 RepID=A0A972GMX5_9BACL|nr:extracellular solute-binding protein [Paenibacillus foliorum]NOU93223.1 extracellular solute-binding protein [Paenibacillus foliorum]